MIEFDFNKTLQSPSGNMELQVQASLRPADFVALTGPSGAGKTTILRMLAGLTEADAGRIVVDGEIWLDSVQNINLLPQHRSIGFVFQDYALFPHLSVRENVAYALGSGQQSWLDELIDLTGLAGLQHRLPTLLSGGQKQRVALARAVARKPKLLLLDEPLSALDVDLRAQLQEELRRLQQRLGFSALLVTHDLGEVFCLAHRVLRLEQGRVVQAGTPAEVFLGGRPAGKLHVQAQVLAIRREEVIYVVSLLVGKDVVDVIASAEEANSLHPGELVSVSAKAFSPLIFKRAS